jgi:hypothetical protein
MTDYEEKETRKTCIVIAEPKLVASKWLFSFKFVDAWHSQREHPWTTVTVLNIEPLGSTIVGQMPQKSQELMGQFPSSGRTQSRKCGERVWIEYRTEVITAIEAILTLGVQC